MNYIKNAFIAGLMAFTVLTVHAEHGSYDISIYDVEANRPNNSGFWIPDHYTTKENDNPPFTMVTHTGMDFNIGTVNSDHVPVLSYGFGQVVGINATYNAPTIRHLIDNGQYINVNLLHLHQGSLKVESGLYIVKSQLIGKEGNTGLGATGLDNSTHLHFEVARQVSLDWVPTSLACPGSGCLESERTSNFDIGDLKAYYKINSIDDKATPFRGRVWYDPVLFAAHKELLPYLSMSAPATSVSASATSIPSPTNYDVYGTSTNSVYGQLNVKGDFQQSSIIVRKTFDRGLIGQVINDSLSDEQRFLGGRHIGLDVDGINGNTTYQRGNYLFSAYVKQNDEQRFGYPVKFSIVNDSEVIVDNDQLSSSDTSFYCTPGCGDNKVPGYFLTAAVLTANVNQLARWHPRRRGNFNITIHIPEYGNYKQIIYHICPTGHRLDCVQRTISTPSAGWSNTIMLSGDRPEQFSFTKSGYVMVEASGQGQQTSEIPVDAVKFSAYNGTWYVIKRELKVTYDSARKVYRHFMESSDEPSVSLQGNDGTVNYEETVENGIVYSKYSNSTGTVYVSHKTGNIATLIGCNERLSAWESPYERLLDKLNASTCTQTKGGK